MPFPFTYVKAKCPKGPEHCIRSMVPLFDSDPVLQSVFSGQWWTKCLVTRTGTRIISDPCLPFTPVKDPQAVDVNVSRPSRSYQGESWKLRRRRCGQISRYCPLFMTAQVSSKQGTHWWDWVALFILWKLQPLSQSGKATAYPTQDLQLLYLIETKAVAATEIKLPSPTNAYSTQDPPKWGAADAEIKVPSGENTERKRSPFEAWSRSVYSHTCYAYCQGFFPCLFLPFQFIHLHFFQSLS